MKYVGGIVKIVGLCKVINHPFLISGNMWQYLIANTLAIDTRHLTKIKLFFKKPFLTSLYKLQISV